MARIQPLTYEESDAARRAAYDEIERTIGHMTNMKRTMLHSLPVLHALLEWYPLHDAVAAFLGARRANLLSHAISVRNDCLVCSTYFRRILIDAGENPDALVMDDIDQVLVDFGRQLAAEHNQVDEAVYQRLAIHFTPEQIVILTGFGALMVATNIINSVLDVPLDDYLVKYVRPAALN